MSSTWGAAWGASWANAWGSSSTEPPEPPPVESTQLGGSGVFEPRRRRRVVSGLWPLTPPTPKAQPVEILLLIGAL